MAKYCYLFLPRFCLWRKSASEKIILQVVSSKAAFSLSLMLCFGVYIFSILMWLPGFYILSLLYLFGDKVLFLVLLLVSWLLGLNRLCFYLPLSTMVSYWGSDLLGWTYLCSDLLVPVLLVVVCSNSGGFSLWVWVLYSMGYWLLTDYFVYFDSLGSWARINVASFLFALAFDHRSGILHYLLAEWFSLLFVKMFEIMMV